MAVGLWPRWRVTDHDRSHIIVKIIAKKRFFAIANSFSDVIIPSGRRSALAVCLCAIMLAWT